MGKFVEHGGFAGSRIAGKEGNSFPGFYAETKRREHFEPGSPVTVADAAGEQPARVVALPFVPGS